MPLGLFWYANMTYQPTGCMASIHEVWRLIMRSIVFTKCEEESGPGDAATRVFKSVLTAKKCYSKFG
jgi:hypothetical protein